MQEIAYMVAIELRRAKPWGHGPALEVWVAAREASRVGTEGSTVQLHTKCTVQVARNKGLGLRDRQGTTETEGKGRR